MENVSVCQRRVVFVGLMVNDTIFEYWCSMMNIGVVMVNLYICHCWCLLVWWWQMVLDCACLMVNDGVWWWMLVFNCVKWWIYELVGIWWWTLLLSGVRLWILFLVMFNSHLKLIDGAFWCFLVFGAEFQCLIVLNSEFRSLLLCDVEFWCLVITDSECWYLLVFEGEFWSLLLYDGEFWCLVIVDGECCYLLVFEGEYNLYLWLLLFDKIGCL